MTVRYPDAAQQHKALLQLLVLEILKNYTDPEHPITKQKVIEKATELCGFEPARNTIYDDIKALIKAGFPIEQTGKGVYYDGKSLSDGELRFLIDSVLYSDLMTKNGASEVIEALASLGSVEFQKYTEKQKARISITRKGKQPNMFMAIEDIQTAIYHKKQISFNYLTYRPDCTQEKVYTEAITVNPYDLVYKNGRYFLLGAIHDEKKICSWRVDRLCDVELLKTGRRDVPQLKEISAIGGMNAYVDTQPDLCGGVVETFKIQCATDAIDEIVDVFGGNFSEAPEQINNYDDETVILSVKATRESMKAWSFTHADRMVVISPEDFRNEITDSLSEAQRMYRITGKPLQVRLLYSRNFEEAVHWTKKSARKQIVYHGNGHREKEIIDLNLISDFTDLSTLSLSDCQIEHPEIISGFKRLRTLRLRHCDYPAEILCDMPNLFELAIDTEAGLQMISDHQNLRKLYLSVENIHDLTPVTMIPALKTLSLAWGYALTDCVCLQDASALQYLEIRECRNLKDFSFLKKMQNLKYLSIDSPFFTVEDGIRLHEQFGVEVHIRHLRDVEPEILDKLGCNPHSAKNHSIRQGSDSRRKFLP